MSLLNEIKMPLKPMDQKTPNGPEKAPKPPLPLGEGGPI